MRGVSTCRRGPGVGGSGVIDRSADRWQGILDAVLGMSVGSNLDVTLHGLVQAAVDLLDAGHGAAAVWGESGTLDRFVQVGVDEITERALGIRPCGGGVLEMVASDGQPLQVGDLTRHPAFAGVPPGHPPAGSFLAVPIRSRGQVVGQLSVTGRAGGQVFTDDDEATVQVLADAVGVAVGNAHLAQEGRRTSESLAASAEVTTELLGSGGTGQALNLIACRAMEMSSADTTCVLVPSDPQLASVEVTDLRVAVCVGDDSPRQQDLMIVVAGSTSGAVFTDRTSRMVLASAGVPGVDSMLGPTMAAPLGPAEWNLGVVVVRRTPGSPAFADTDLARLSLFAENAALAVHLAEGQRHRELQVLAERDRISTELYDHVWQQLFGIGTAMQITRRRMPSPDSEARTGDHIDQLQGVVRQLRQAISDGLPGPAVPPQLRTSLMQMITVLTAGSPLHTSVHMSGTLDDLPPDLALLATEVLREAVGNAVRHSHAEELGITISVTDDLVVVQVTDNGVGTTDTTPGAGLRDLQRRATDVAGSLIVSGARGAGTHLTWTAPVP